MKKKKILAGIGIIVGTLLVSVGLRGLGLFAEGQKVLSKALYHEREISNDIVIVAMDNKSIAPVEEGGLGWAGFWPRIYHSQVLETIETGEPSTVMMDILFLTESTFITEQEIVETAVEYPKATEFATEVLEYLATIHPHDQTFADTLAKYENVYLIKSTAGEGIFDGNTLVYENDILPMDLFAENSNLAYYNLVSSEASDNLSTIYSFPTLLTVDGKTEEHIFLQVTRDYLNRNEPFEIPTENGQMLINYASEPFGYSMVSFSDVYYGRVEPEIFKDKIVLVGATASLFHDDFYTPISTQRKMPGVEVHANAIQTVLDDAYLEHQSISGFLLLVGLIAVMSVFVFLYAPVIAGSAFLVAEIVTFPFYAQWSFGRGVIPDLIWPVFAMAVSYLAVLVYRNLTEFAEKRKLKLAFSRYVSPELAEEITEKPELLKLGGERKNITALFLDIENFTTLSEGLEPQEVVRVINVYFDALAQVIMGHGGSVDKYEGDAIMALFGAPVPSTDHAVKACFAAMAIQARMKELNAQMGYNLNIRIGLATGDAIVGNMGSSQRFDYTAMGDTVNTASRLEGANKFYKTGILVNPGTFEAAQSQIFFRKVDTVCLKGKENAIGIYQVLGTQEGATPDGKAVVAEWQSALDDYKAANWDDAEKKIRSVLTKMPEDGPATTFLSRIAELKLLPKQEWDGVWKFESK